MAILCMIYGQSGTGKSTSLRNFKHEEVAVINVSGKPLPFRGNIKPYNSDNYQKIMSAISQTERKSIVIDDSTYLMVNEFMRTAKQTGYQKYTDMAVSFNQLIEFAAALPDDKVVYFMGHSDQSDDGREHFKTIGKMLDNYVTVEGRFTIVLKTVVQDGRYMFSTQNNGQDTVKSPMGLFDSALIDNDLKAVDRAIREYWEIGSNES
ncbi:MAG: AAA family ATPase [Clostridia bacterium]|nr:AAA family ATPase [Clostridia bacterium]